ncbi:MAG: BlaI/MecI/CopY family transcriptional regulator [Clostridiales bacterium]|nr:BlaI/MecI/CopY family transcriptional regulator [Clostridiales bacterium]
MPERQCTEAEWKIMELLWDRAPRPMSEITKELEPATGWSRHTVITLLKRMQEKHTVAVDESGDVKMYSPLITREEASQMQTKKLLNRVFSGKASLLINHLVDSGEITLKEMDELMEMLHKSEKR